jgi:hypothetical protein
LAKIHQYRSSIETALKMGTPVKEVISAHFTNPATAAGIMNVINQHKAGVA